MAKEVIALQPITNQKDIFALQDEVALAVRHALLPNAESRPTVDP